MFKCNLLGGYLLVLCTTISVAQSTNTDIDATKNRALDGLYGTVKKVVSKTILYNERERLNEDTLRIEEEVYSKQGLKLTMKLWEIGDIDSTTEAYIHDNKGKLTRKILSMGSDTTVTYEAKRSATGRLLEETLAEAEYDPPLKQYYKYNKSGLLSKSLTYTLKSSTLVSSKTFLYNKNHTLISVRYLDENNRLWREEKYLYEPKKVSKEITVTHTGEPLKEFEVDEFSNEDLLVKQSKRDDQGKLLSEKIISYYANRLKKQEIEIYPDDPAQFKIIYSYDNLENITKIITESKDKSSITEETYQYKFDKKNNWVEEKMVTCKTEMLTRACKPSSRTVREIVYY